MTTQVFGVRIRLEDRASPFTANSSIGLYNQVSNVVAVGQHLATTLNLASTVGFGIGDVFVPTADDISSTISHYVTEVDQYNIAFTPGLFATFDPAQGAAVWGDSQLRWIQNSVPGLIQDWNSDMLRPNGLTRFTRSVNLEDGGNTADVGGGTVKLVNTDQLSETLENTLEIRLPGRTVELVHFEDTTPVIQQRGIAKQPVWDAAEYRISVRGERTKRNANIVTEKNVEGSDRTVDVPATFGEFSDSQAQMKRTLKIDTDLSLELLAQEFKDNGGLDFTPDPTIRDRLFFPVVLAGTSPTLDYDVRLDNVGKVDLDGSLDYEPENLYLLVIEHNPDSGTDITGTYRRVDRIQKKTVDTITVTLADYLSNDLFGDTGGDKTWVKFLTIERAFKLDEWPCKSFLNLEGEEIVNGVQLFVFDESATVKIATEEIDSDIPVPINTKPLGYFQIPSYAYDEAGDGNNNRVQITPKLLNDSIDSFRSFFIYPITDLEFIDDDTTTYREKWGFGSTVAKKETGLYGTSLSASYSFSINSGSLANVIDKSHLTKISYNLDHNVLQTNYISLQMKAPSIDDSVSFEKAYFGIMLLIPTMPSAVAHNLLVAWRRFMGTLTAIQNNQAWIATGLATSGRAESLPDFYYTSDRSTQNEYFYVEKNDVAVDTEKRITSYTLFELPGITTLDKYRSIDQLGLFFGHNSATDSIDFDLYQLALILQKDHTIADELYTYCKGRIYNANWSQRVIESDLITSPRRILEAIFRLQSWSDTSEAPTLGWGKDYAANPLVKLTGTGSIDDAALAADLDAYSIARQLTSFEEGWTADLKQSLCREFSLVNYVDEAGYECVRQVKKELETPDELITLADIRKADSKIRVTQPDPSNIYAEPFVRYQYDVASDTYLHTISFSNVNSLTYDPSFVVSPDEVFSGSEAEEYWNRCVSNYDKAGVINRPPAYLTDLQWANGPSAHDVAKQRIKAWIDWMALKTIQFNVGFLTDAGGGSALPVRRWQEGKKFRLRLPHETNNVTIECVLTRIVIDPNPPYHIEVFAIPLEDSDIPEDFDVQFVYFTESEGADADWTLDYELRGDDSDKDFVY